ncbi:hypothetical protein Vadar_017834 [Vaccinium darrowii]|uniref:Uncharacterized protein n=1 Tax=Vaccinium darrowii TaxID=229202 RepID=A0ACB7YWQ0_9ERIC|nr:hypothetical protein Vadar_017834 [Vaccinium darrowii]
MEAAWSEWLANEGDSVNITIPSHTMEKVLEWVRMLQPSCNKSWYDPVLVSICPFHHGKPELQSVEKLKFQFAK